jgi:4-amino-4-deoxy-L-arabinose transferase-like glycosyltransferase
MEKAEGRRQKAEGRRQNGGGGSAFRLLPSDFIELLVIIIVWAAAIAFIDPRGNFPLHDDWDFAIATFNFARSGHFEFTNFTAVSLRAMVLWGAAWTGIFGQSFEVLRASTLTLSLGTLLVVNRTLARAGAVRGVRLFACAALLVHPLFLWLSCTYMTDIPFVFVSAVAFYCFVRALESDSMPWLTAACVAVVVSWFIRQNGVVTLAAPLVLLLLRREQLTPRWRAFLLVIGAYLGAFAMLFVFRREWLSGSPAMFATHYHMWLESSFRLPEQVAVLQHYVLFNAQNVALFFLPLTLPLLAAIGRLRRRDAILLGVIALIVVWRLSDLALAGYLLPYTTDHIYSDILPGNLFINFGLGVPMLYDTFSLHLPYPFTIGTAARATLTALSGVATIAMLWTLLRARGGLVLQLALAGAAAGTLALFGSGYYYDRYSLDSAWVVVLALPLLTPPLNERRRRFARLLACVALACVAAFALLSVQEYFCWQRARWQVWDAFRAQGIAVEQIDGGAEAFGFYELAHAPLAVARRGHPARPYAIAFRPLDGYRVVMRVPFRSFLGMRVGELVGLAR